MTPLVLIVRTVSIEEMGPVIDACRAQWPSARLCALTSANRHAELAHLGRLDEVVDYPAAFGGFGQAWHDGRRYAAVVLPVRNASAWGYANVWQAVAGTTADSVWIAQWGRTLCRVGRARLTTKFWIERAVRAACRWPARVLGLLFLAHSRRREQTS